MKLEILNPHGFCAGVKSALEKARRLIKSGERVYCLHEIVHNEIVVAELKDQGFVFVEDINDIPDGSKVLFSAHGVSPTIREIAKNKNLTIEDATCPFVARVHKAATDFHKRGLLVIVVGKSFHAEVKGIIGEAPGAQVISSIEDIERLKLLFNKSLKVGVVSQTTMNADDVAKIVSALSQYFTVESVAEVCNATKDRQDAVKAFKGDALLVLGSVTSSNTRRLCEVASSKTYRAGSIDEVMSIDFNNISHLGVTSGASTPEEFFDTVLSIINKIIS